MFKLHGKKGFASKEVEMAGQTFDGTKAGELIGQSKPELNEGEEVCVAGGLVQRYTITVQPASAVLVILDG